MPGYKIKPYENEDLTYFATVKGLISYQRSIGKPIVARQCRSILQKMPIKPDDPELKNVEGVQKWAYQAATNAGLKFTADQKKELEKAVSAAYDQGRELLNQGVIPYSEADPRNVVQDLFQKVPTPFITVNQNNGFPKPNSPVLLTYDPAVVGRRNHHIATIAPFLTPGSVASNQLNAEQTQRLRNKRAEQFNETQRNLRQAGYRVMNLKQVESLPVNSQTKGIAQLGEYLRPYLDDNSWAQLKRIVAETAANQTHYNDQRLKQSVELLQYFKDQGIDYELVRNTQNPKNIQVVLTNAAGFSAKPRVTLVDGFSKPGFSRVGDIYTGEANYFFVTNKRAYMTDKPWLPTMVALGRTPMVTQYNNNQLEKVTLRPLDERGQQMTPFPIQRWQRTSAHSKAYQNVVLQPNLEPAEADAQLDKMIREARKVYMTRVTGDSLDEINAPLAEEQHTLADYANELLGDAVDDEQREKIIDEVKHLARGEEVAAPAEASRQIANHLSEMADEFAGISDQIRDELGREAGPQQINFNHVYSLVSENEEYGADARKALINALKCSTWSNDGAELIGNEDAVIAAREQLIQFDQESTQTPQTADSQDKRNLLNYVQRKLSNDYGLENAAVAIDKHGVIRWTGNRTVGVRSKRQQQLTGEIGQIFLPDEKGVIHTQFNDPNGNIDFVPGSTGHFQYAGLDEGKSRMQRFRIKNYALSVKDHIDYALQQQVLRNPINGYVASPTDSSIMNKLYHGDLYGRRLEPNWYENNPLPDEAKDAILDTLERRVRLSNEIGHVANSFLEASADDHAHDEQASLVDNKNIRVLDDDYLGYFDMVMTGTNKAQGLVLYRGNGVTVNRDGSLNRVRDENGKPKEVKAPTRELDYFKYSNLNPWDRNQMAANQLLTAKDVAKNTHLMLATFGGWTFEDSCVVSKEWAEKHPVMGEDGKMRPLMKGDKISDFSGNKATIGLVVDPEMSAEDAKLQKLENEVAIFKQNPELEVVMSPYAMVSRQNAGIVRELIDSDDKAPVTYVDADGNEHQVGVRGTANMIVTDMIADHKTKVYGREAFAAGNGRKASSQLMWALNELGLEKTTKYMFSNNDSSWRNVRERLLAVGMDMLPDGKLVMGYHPREDEERPLFAVQFDTKDLPADKPLTTLDVRKLSRQQGDVFAEEIMKSDGILKLPFEVPTQGIDSEGKHIWTDELVIMKPSTRHNLEKFDGTVSVNDTTLKYQNIYRSAYEYTAYQAQLDKLSQRGELTPELQARFQRQMERSKQATITACKTLQQEIITKDFGGMNGENKKHCSLKERLLNKRQAASATAIQTADPRLPLDTIKVSPKIAQALRLRKDELVVIERDPILRGSGLWAMKWKVDPDLTGIAVNPTIAGAYDGDFDGDTLGVFAIHDKEAQAELQEKATFANRMKDPGTNGCVVAGDMDLISSGLKSGVVSADKEQGTPEDQIADKFSEIMNKTSKVNNEDKVVNKFNAASLSNYVVDGLLHNKANFGAANIDITNVDTAKHSVKVITDTGAKGSPAKAAEFNEYIDGKKTLHDAQRVQLAAGLKSDLTGVAGAMSQRLVRAFRNTDIKTALETTYPNTQGTLQIKHDPAKGKQVLQALTHDLPNLMAGVDRNTNKSEQDKVTRLTREEWVNQMETVYHELLGVGGVEQHIETLSKLMVDPESGRMNSLQELGAKHADVIDMAVYGDGFTSVQKAAMSNQRLVNGKNTQWVVPEIMREAQAAEGRMEQGKTVADTLAAEHQNIQEFIQQVREEKATKQEKQQQATQSAPEQAQVAQQNAHQGQQAPTQMAPAEPQGNTQVSEQQAQPEQPMPGVDGQLDLFNQAPDEPEPAEEQTMGPGM